MDIQKINKWISAIIYEDGDKMHPGSLKTLQMIKNEITSVPLGGRVMQLPDKEEILKTAMALSDNLTANEQAFFVAGFQECIKYLQNRQSA